MPATYDDRLNGITTSVAVKAPCRVATTAAITLSGLQTIDGVTVVAGDRVLVKDQADETANGIYDAATTAWQRVKDFDGALDAVKGTLVKVNEGTAGADSFWTVTTANPVIFGTSDITFAQSNSALAGVSAFVEGLLDDPDAATFRASIGAAADAEVAKLASVNTFTATQIWKKGVDIASAATLVLGTDGNKFNVTGNTGPITAITVAAGTLFMLTFDSTPTLTHHATNLILPGGANITAAAGDRLIGFANAANQVEVLAYTKADGTAVVAAASGGSVTTITAQTNFPSANNVDITSIPQTYTDLVLKVTGASNATDTRTLRVLLSTDNGSTWSSNQINGFSVQNGTVVAHLAVASVVNFPTIAAATNASFVLTISNYRATTTNMVANGNYASGSNAFSTITGHSLDGAINAIRLIWDSTGNFDAGNYTLYGIQ
jgi:hypothetical protein